MDKRNLLVIILGLGIIYLLFPHFEYYINPRDPLLYELKSQLEIIHPVFKNVELYEGKKSYTLNKKHVYICLKDTHGRYYNRNMLIYVILHEFSHILNKDGIGHTKKFFEIFHQLLEHASKLGLYNPSIPPLDDYCGHS